MHGVMHTQKYACIFVVIEFIESSDATHIYTTIHVWYEQCDYFQLSSTITQDSFLIPTTSASCICRLQVV